MVQQLEFFIYFFIYFLQRTKGNAVTDETQPGNCQNNCKNENKPFMLTDQEIFPLIIRLDKIYFSKETKLSKHNKMKQVELETYSCKLLKLSKSCCKT